MKYCIDMTLEIFVIRDHVPGNKASVQKVISGARSACEVLSRLDEEYRFNLAISG